MGIFTHKKKFKNNTVHEDHIYCFVNFILNANKQKNDS